MLKAHTPCWEKVPVTLPLKSRAAGGQVSKWARWVTPAIAQRVLLVSLPTAQCAPTWIGRKA